MLCRDLPKPKQELASILSNLHVVPKSYYEECKQIARAAEILEAGYPTTKHGGVRQRGVRITLPSAVNLLARMLAVDEQTVRDRVKVATGLTEELYNQLPSTVKEDRAQVLSLARQKNKDRQAEAVRYLVSGKARKAPWAINLVDQDHSSGNLLPATGDDYELHVGDCWSTGRNVLKAASVDLILVDPPWVGNAIPVYEKVAKLAAYALKRHGLLVVMFGHPNYDRQFALVCKHMRFTWPFALCFKEQVNVIPNLNNSQTRFQPMALFRRRGLPYTGPPFVDRIEGCGPYKRYHEWGFHPAEFEQIIKMFCKPGMTVLDCCVGGGSVAVAALNSGMRFVGIDLHANCIAKTKRHIADWKEAKSKSKNFGFDELKNAA